MNHKSKLKAIKSCLTRYFHLLDFKPFAASLFRLNFFLLQSGSSAWNETDVDILKKSLFKNYDVLTRPENFQTVTNCHVTMTLINIDFDETRGVLTSHAWLKMNWTDSKLSWDKQMYNISELRVQSDEAR